MVSVFAASALVHGFDHKDHNIGMCCFSAKHVALRSKTITELRKQDNVSELSDMFTLGLFLRLKLAL